MKSPRTLTKDEKEKENSKVSEIPKKKIVEKNILLYEPNISNHEFEKKSISLDSTNDNSKKLNTNIFYNNSSINSSQNNTYIEKEKTFNVLRQNFYIKNNLNDVELYTTLTNFLEKYKLSENSFSYLYPNELKTYPICISGFIFKPKNKITIDISISNKDIYDTNYGLCFCNKNIEITNANQALNKKCEPNQFMCRDCMEINKKMYNIKSKYLININGRVAKINKGSYHCFGHYLDNNQIEDCIHKFSCKACKILEEFSKYYI